MRLLPINVFTLWLANGERGVSSEAIVERLTGVPVGTHRWGIEHPHDPSDFRRCELLLTQVPLARMAFSSMRDVSPEWGRLVEAWDDITALIESEVPGYLGRNPRGAAPKAYALMQRVIHNGEPCEPCEGTGSIAPCDKCKGAGRRSGGRCRAQGCFSGWRHCPACRGKGYTLRDVA